ncbi:MAG: mercury(II) reductase, partial [Acidobacteriota bacterium]
HLPLGGTCVNVGCVPSKTLLRAAAAAYETAHPRFAGIEPGTGAVDFQAVMAQKGSLVEALRASKYEDVVAAHPEMTLIRGHARLFSAGAVEVSGKIIKADRILLATGARPAVPDVPGLASSEYLTSQTALDLTQRPESLLVLGGRYVALEMAQLFARLGCRVAVLQRSDRILPTENAHLTEALQEYLKEEGLRIETGVRLKQVRRRGNGVEVETTTNGARRVFEATHLLVATGRVPNSGGMDLSKLGVAVDANGFVEVDETLQTGVKGIYAAGDLIGPPMFVYTAAYEGALAAENALTGNGKVRDYTAQPWVVFTDPQFAGVGLDMRQAAAAGLDVEQVTLPLESIPRALAARNTRGKIQLIRERSTDRLVGGRILAPEGSELLMEISLAIKFGVTCRQLAEAFHPYLTHSEGVKLAAIAFRKDVSQLSCCAV